MMIDDGYLLSNYYEQSFKRTLLTCSQDFAFLLAVSGKGAVMPAIRARFYDRNSKSISRKLFCNHDISVPFPCYSPTLHSFPSIAATSPPRCSPLAQWFQVSILASLIRDSRRWICPALLNWFSTPIAAIIFATPATLSTFFTSSPSTSVVAESVPKWNIPATKCIPVFKSIFAF